MGVAKGRCRQEWTNRCREIFFLVTLRYSVPQVASRCWNLQRRTLAPGRSSHALAKCEVKSAACAKFTVYPDAAAHFSHQSGTDGQTQSHSPVSSRRRAVGLGKNVEDRLLFLGRYPDSRVRHRAMQKDSVPQWHLCPPFQSRSHHAQ